MTPAPSGAQRHGRRRKSSSLPMIIGGSIAALALLGVVIGVLASLGGGNSQPPPVAKVPDPAPPPSPAPAPPEVVERPPEAPATRPALDAAPFAALRPGILNLAIRTPGESLTATCFLLDERGHAVTCYHAIAQAVSVEAFGSDQTRAPVLGSVALDVDHNLAIVRLSPGILASPLKLAEDDLSADGDVASFAGPAGSLQWGRARGSTVFSRLSPSMRSHLKGLTGDWADDTTIILHSLKLADESCGTPLFNAQGEVAGLHVAADRDGSAAIHARHIRGLLARVSEEPQPFSNSLAVAPPTFELDPVATAPPMPEPETDPVDTLLSRLEEHRDACAKLNWTATDAADYAQFQLFARFLAQATDQATSDPLESVRDRLAPAVREALAPLSGKDRPTEDAWSKTNVHAAAAFDASPGQGVVALMRVMIPTSQGNILGDDPIIVAEVVGQSQMVVLPMKGGDTMGVDDQFVVVGLHDPDVRVNFKNIPLPLVRARHVLAVEK